MNITCTTANTTIVTAALFTSLRIAGLYIA